MHARTKLSGVIPGTCSQTYTKPPPILILLIWKYSKNNGEYALSMPVFKNKYLGTKSYGESHASRDQGNLIIFTP